MIPLPSIPTDNLYKFIFVSGLTLIFGGAILFATQYNTISKRMDDLTIEIVKLEAEGGFITDDISKLESQTSKMEKNLKGINRDTTSEFKHYKTLTENAYKDKEYREYLKFIFSYKEDIYPFYVENKNVEQNLIDLETKTRTHKLNTLLLSEKTKQLKRELYVLLFWSIVFIISFSIGLRMSQTGYKNWYLHVQQPTDEKIKIELDKLKSDKLA